MAEQVDIAVIGAGAAGLTAAIFAGREALAHSGRLQIAAYDGALRIGAKIVISGGGRCNVTHDVVHPADFNGGSRNRIARVLRTFTVDDTIDVFEELGVSLKREETGKLFPVSDRARDVVDALLRAADEASASIITSARVTRLAADGERFSLTAGERLVQARSVVLATGGRSVPKTGSDGFGYSLATGLGHTLTKNWPALVPLLLPPGHWLTSLRGITVEVELALRDARGRILRRESGSLLFTHFGLSGPVVLDMSRHWIEAAQEGTPDLRMNLFPGDDLQSIERRIQETALSRPRLHVGNLLTEILPERLGGALLEQFLPEGGGTRLGQLGREERRTIGRALTELKLAVTGNRGFDYAEVTAGGVPLEEIDVGTMQSRIVPGLYLCGEILDVDGKIGGYNFQWAWASGRLAGISAAARLRD
jgi:predicted Rossmann fold flavoprotein